MSEALKKNSPADYRDRRVLELWERVVEVEQRLIPTGLHVFGRAARADECADLLRAVASFDRPEFGARARARIVEGLRAALGRAREALDERGAGRPRARPARRVRRARPRRGRGAEPFGAADGEE